MSTHYTPQQLQVITTKNRNLLTSAAAGSGKTAVLVERIIRMLCDSEKPIEIDQLLIVTFTKAAAAEMKERIGLALEEKLEAEGENEFLNRQLMLLPTAQITTIHSFCMEVIKTYYDVIGIDPGFRVGDEAELALIRKNVLTELLEDAYGEQTPEFLDFTEAYAPGKTDEPIEALILDLYVFAKSNPWPKQWIMESLDKLQMPDLTTYYKSQCYLQMQKEVHKLVQESKVKLEYAKQLALEPNGPIKYIDAIEPLLSYAHGIEGALGQQRESCFQLANSFPSVRLSTASKGIDPELRAEAKKWIDVARSNLKKLGKVYFNFPDDEKRQHIETTYNRLKVLASLTEAFDTRYSKAKTEENIIDFSDIEHFALDILYTTDEQGIRQPSLVAQDYKKQFVEILMDEYQDSNEVQEALLSCLSKEQEGAPNRFMVGDVKQSIYKFRLARPELFIEKYNGYSYEESQYQKIDLQKNFRSRKEVLDCINLIFQQIMSAELGDVTYDGQASLHLGAQYEADETGIFVPEVLLIDKSQLKELEVQKSSGEEETEAEEEEVLSEEEELEVSKLEARTIGLKIQELLQGNGNESFYVTDKKSGGKRPVELRDIVILLRSPAAWADVFMETFKKMNIPLQTETTTGYFDTIEIQTILNVLRLIDNPQQEIPLYSVLRSPIVGMTGEELVEIRTAFKALPMFEALEQYGALQFEQNELVQKTIHFMEMLQLLREKSRVLPIHELLWLIYEKSKYYYYLALTAGGQQRRANLDLLVDKAIAYEKSSFKGVFNFIRYIDHIKKFSIETGEANSLTENDNVVRLISIHKSKGLEFPVVFVGGLGKRFNRMDLNKTLILHQDLGFGSDFIDVEKRFRTETLPKTMIKAKFRRELLSEEMRILYVALTRAKEKLFMVGTIKNLEKSVVNWSNALLDKEISISLELLEKANCFMEWVMMAFMRHPDGQNVREMLDEMKSIPVALSDHPARFKVNAVEPTDLKQAIELVQENRLEIMESFLSKAKEVVVNEALKERLEYSYPYGVATHTKITHTVSDLKRASHMMSQQELEDIETFDNVETVTIHERDTALELLNSPILPKFLQEKTTSMTGAQKGTIMHKVMYYLDLHMTPTSEQLKVFLKELETKEIFSADEMQAIDESALLKFLNSDLCQRMKKADINKKLYKEKSFIIGITGEQLDEALLEEEVMIQGVIDLYFEEARQWILVDYKTDYIQQGQDKLLIERYSEQLGYYKRALEQLTDQKVSETYIYSLSIAKEIKLEI